MESEDRSTEAERRGFLQGLSTGIAWVAGICASWVGLVSIFNVPRFESVFESVKVPIPTVTLLILRLHVGVGVMLLLGAGGCWMAARRWSQKRAITFNTACLVASLLWFALLATGLLMPLLGVLDGIGRKR